MQYYFYMLVLFQKFETTRPFTEKEAWGLFRIAAFAEAIGWTLLIAGILIDKYLAPHDSTMIVLAGRTHGMLFFLYCLAALGLYPSLGWPRLRSAAALLFSVPPYGTLIFEQWAGSKRHNAGFKAYRHFLIYTTLLAQL